MERWCSTISSWPCREPVGLFPLLGRSSRSRPVGNKYTIRRYRMYCMTTDTVLQAQIRSYLMKQSLAAESFGPRATATHCSCYERESVLQDAPLHRDGDSLVPLISAPPVRNRSNSMKMKDRKCNMSTIPRYQDLPYNTVAIPDTLGRASVESSPSSVLNDFCSDCLQRRLQYPIP